MDSAFRVSFPSKAGALLVQVGPLGREALLGVITQGRIELKIKKTKLYTISCVCAKSMYVCVRVCLRFLGIITLGRIELKIREQTCTLPLGCVRGVRMYV